MRAILADLIHFKDKIVLILLIIPIQAMFVAAMQLLHWTSRARMFSSLGAVYGQKSRVIHWKATGKDPFEAAVREAEKQRHPKKHK